MKILFTGGSSFTGYWFIKKLSNSGHQITSVFTAESIDDYSGIRKERILLNSKISDQVFDCRFGSDKFIALIKSGSFDVLCHHAADVTDYKSPDFNIYKAFQSNTNNLIDVLTNIRSDNFKGVILTGSVFEAEEGAGENHDYLDAFSPYGLSKTLTFNCFKYYTAAYGVRLGKFVIPNPFGPYEEPRFTAYLIKNWLSGKVPEVNTPLYFRDNIQVDLLASAYSYFVKQLTDSAEMFLRFNPSGYRESMGDFTKRFSDEMKERIGLPCEFRLNEQKNFYEPMKRVNYTSAADLIKDWNEQKAWDNLAEYYKSEYKK